jgi:aminocarboxymuconate-semialdehyde decarboxylase
VSYVFSHAGGTVPYLAGRFDIIDQMGVIPGAEHRASAAATFRRLYWDTALSWTDPVLRMLRSTVGLDQVLFGTDYPYLRRDLAVSTRRRLLSSPELSPADRTNILGVTAAKLIPRLGSQSRPRDPAR